MVRKLLNGYKKSSTHGNRLPIWMLLHNTTGIFLMLLSLGITLLFYSSVISKHGERIFKSDTKQFIAPPNQLMQPLVGDYSIFTLSGSRHRRERRLLMPPFHGERMKYLWTIDL